MGVFCRAELVICCNWWLFGTDILQDHIRHKGLAAKPLLALKRLKLDLRKNITVARD